VCRQALSHDPRVETGPKVLANGGTSLGQGGDVPTKDVVEIGDLGEGHDYLVGGDTPILNLEPVSPSDAV